MVEGKYLDIKPGAIRPKDLLQPVEGAPASPLLTDLGQPISAGGINQFLLFKALHLLITGLQQKPAPEAYLGYAPSGRRMARTLGVICNYAFIFL
jgi:hypothetical protein